MRGWATCERGCVPLLDCMGLEAGQQPQQRKGPAPKWRAEGLAFARGRSRGAAASLAPRCPHPSCPAPHPRLPRPRLLPPPAGGRVWVCGGGAVGAGRAAAGRRAAALPDGGARRDHHQVHAFGFMAFWVNGGQQPVRSPLLSSSCRSCGTGRRERRDFRGCVGTCYRPRLTPDTPAHPWPAAATSTLRQPPGA